MKNMHKHSFLKLCSILIILFSLCVSSAQAGKTEEITERLKKLADKDVIEELIEALPSQDLDGFLKALDNNLNQLRFADMTPIERKDLIRALKDVKLQDFAPLVEAIDKAIPQILIVNEKGAKDLVLLCVKVDKDKVIEIGKAVPTVIHQNADYRTKVALAKMLAEVPTDEIPETTAFFKAQAERLCGDLPGYQQFAIYDAVVRFPLDKVRLIVDEVLAKDKEAEAKGKSKRDRIAELISRLKNFDVKKIDPLKAALSRPDRYQVCLEGRLIKVQQVLALQFFDFDSAEFTALLEADEDLLERLEKQSKVIEEKIEALKLAKVTLDHIIEAAASDDDFTWGDILDNPQIYKNMRAQLSSWAQETLTESEQRQYEAFLDKMDRMHEDHPDSLELLLNERTQLIKEVKKSLDEDPDSAASLDIADRWMKMAHALYGQECVELNLLVWEKGIEKHVGDDYPTDPKIVEWLNKATEAYWRGRIYRFFDEVERDQNAVHRDAWEKLLQEMCGDSEKMRQEIAKAVAKDEKIGVQAKKWLEEQ